LIESLAKVTSIETSIDAGYEDDYF